MSSTEAALPPLLCGKPTAFRLSALKFNARLRLAERQGAALLIKIPLNGKAEPFRTAKAAEPHLIAYVELTLILAFDCLTRQGFVFNFAAFVDRYLGSPVIAHAALFRV